MYQVGHVLRREQRQQELGRDVYSRLRARSGQWLRCNDGRRLLFVVVILNGF